MAAAKEPAWHVPGMQRIGPFLGRWPVRMTVIRSPALQLPRTLPRGLEPVLYDNPLAALLALTDDQPAVVVVPTDVTGVAPIAVIEAVASCTDVPVVVASRETEELLDLAGQGLTAGASAFVSLPFEYGQLEDLMVRFGGRRTWPAIEVVQVGPLRVDGSAFRVMLDDRAVKMPAREFEVLQFLVGQHPRVVSVEELADRWSAGSRDSITVLIYRLRKRLAAVQAVGARPLIETVRGRGYRLNVSV
jgi:DNA-binding response OmpR family regulator